MLPDGPLSYGPHVDKQAWPGVKWIFSLSKKLLRRGSTEARLSSAKCMYHLDVDDPAIVGLGHLSDGEPRLGEHSRQTQEHSLVVSSTELCLLERPPTGGHSSGNHGFTPDPRLKSPQLNATCQAHALCTPAWKRQGDYAVLTSNGFQKLGESCVGGVVLLALQCKF